MSRLVIIGTSETAERILAFCQIYQLYDVIGFAVDRQYRRMNSFHDLPVWDLETLDQQIDKDNVSIYVAIFWNHLNGDRREMYERLKFEGYSFANIISPRSSVRGIVGDNCWVMDNVVVQEGAKVGNNVIIADNALVGNLSQVGHHCFIGVHSTIMGGGNYWKPDLCRSLYNNLRELNNWRKEHNRGYIHHKRRHSCLYCCKGSTAHSNNKTLHGV